MRAPYRLVVLVAGAVWFAAAPSPIVAAPVDPALQAEMMAIYDQWNKAVAAGTLNDGLKLRSTAQRAMFAKEMKTQAAQREMLAMLRAMAPETVEVQHAERNKDGTKITIETIIGKTMPKGVKQAGAPPAGTRLRNEMTLIFRREAGAWKFDGQQWGMDPARVKPCASTGFPGMAAFEERENLSIGGQIRRVNFGPDHTLVVIRMFDEENCIYLPPKARLAELGFNADLLVPWSIIEIGAWPHRTDKQSVWAETLGIVDPD